MYTIQHNPARLHTCDETGITIVQHKHTKILGFKGKRQIFSVPDQSTRTIPRVGQRARFSPSGFFISSNRQS